MQLVCGTIAEAGHLLQEEETVCACQFIKVKNSGKEDTVERDGGGRSGPFFLKGSNSIAVLCVVLQGSDVFSQGGR